MFEIVLIDTKFQKSDVLFSGTQDECLANKQLYEATGYFAPEQNLEIKEVL